MWTVVEKMRSAYLVSQPLIDIKYYTSMNESRPARNHEHVIDYLRARHGQQEFSP